MHLIGVDIGGTKICVCLGTDKGEIISSERIDTRSLANAEKGVSAIEEIALNLLSKKGLCIKKVDAIGLSCPGPMSKKKGMILNPPNLVGWENAPLQKWISDKLGRPTFMNNDANAAALAEWAFGAFKGTENLIYLTLSTGLGGGIIANGRLLQGVTDTAGEVGHLVVQTNSPLMTGGLHGTFEAYCGGLSIAKQVQSAIKEKNIKTKIIEEADGNIDAIEIKHLIEALKKKDEFAEEVWDTFVERLAQGIGILIQVLNPEAIVLGTIAVHAQGLLLSPLYEKLPKYAWAPPLLACKIEPTILGKKISELSGLAVALEGLQSKE